MTVTVEKTGVNEVKLNIEAAPEVSSFEYDKACRKLAQRVNVPGFRRGKAPKNILEKYVGIAAIEREVLDSIVPVMVEQAVEENNFDLIAVPNIESFEFAEDKSLKASVKLELRPDVNLPDYNKMIIEIEEFKNSENALEDELKRVSERFAEFKDITDRKSSNTDFVNIDFIGYADGEEIKGGSAKNYMLDIANSNFIPGFAEQLVNHSAGEEFKIQVKFPDEYHDEKLKGKDAEFNIKLNAVKERILPEINDDLAKRVNPKFNTLDDLKKDIQSYLDNTAKTENNRRISNKIFEILLEQTNIELSDTMINREIQALMAEFRQRASMQGGNFDEMLEREGHEKIYNQMKEEAVKRIKTSLITGKIAQNENITVTNEDVSAQISGLASVYRTSANAVISEIQKNPAVLNSINQQIIIGKVTKLLAEKAEVKYTNK